MFDEYLSERSRTADESFVPFDAVRDYATHVENKPHLDGIRSFLASRDIELPENTLRALIERQGEILRSLLKRERAETYEGSVRYIRALRAAGLRTAVVSSSKYCADVLAAGGIADLFDARVDGVVAAEKHLADMPAPDTSSPRRTHSASSPSRLPCSKIPFPESRPGGRALRLRGRRRPPGPRRGAVPTRRGRRGAGPGSAHGTGLTSR